MNIHNPEVVLFHELMRESFSLFCSEVFRQTSGPHAYHPGWHNDALAWHLEQAALRKIKRLIITLPPRYGKSTSATVALPAWVLGRNPAERVICVSYSSELAEKFARDCRGLMQSAMYRRTFPGARLDARKSAAADFETTMGGFRLTTSVGGTLTGRGGSYIVIDDPLKGTDAASEAARKNVWEWFGNTVASRLDNKSEGVIILVTQRMHMDDLPGRLLQMGGWSHLNLPAIAQEEMVIEKGFGENHTFHKGEALHPAIESLEHLERQRQALGPFNFSAQYLQDPVPEQGNIIRPDWFRRYVELPQRSGVWRIVQSWDIALGIGDKNDYSVCTTWLIIGREYYLIDVMRVRREFPDLRRTIIDHAANRSAGTVLLEKDGLGLALYTDLSRNGPSGRSFIGRKADADKKVRLLSVTDMIEGGQVLIPKEAPWVEEFLLEMRAFPYGKYDDQVDSLSQFLIWKRQSYNHDSVAGSQIKVFY
jgi:predicted phage terminase large subunit-like protein